MDHTVLVVFNPWRGRAFRLSCSCGWSDRSWTEQAAEAKARLHQVLERRDAA